MTQEQVLAIKKYCEAAYPIMKTNIDDDLVWIDMLKEYQYEGMMATTKKYILNSNRFPPTLSDLVKNFEYELTPFNKQVFYEMELNGEFEDRTSEDSEIRAWNTANRKRRVKHHLSTSDENWPSWFREMYQKYHDEIKKLYFGGNKNENRFIETQQR